MKTSLLGTTDGFKLTDYKRADGTYEEYAWPGGYQMFYLCFDGEALCAECVNENEEIILSAIHEGDSDPSWVVVGADINYENDDLVCANCWKPIPASYGK